MARVNVYLPDELAEEVRAAGLNVSNVTQEALRRELASRQTATWLQSVRAGRGVGLSHDQTLAALDAVRSDDGDEWPASTSWGVSP